MPDTKPQAPQMQVPNETPGFFPKFLSNVGTVLNSSFNERSYYNRYESPEVWEEELKKMKRVAQVRIVEKATLPQECMKLDYIESPPPGMPLQPTQLPVKYLEITFKPKSGSEANDLENSKIYIACIEDYGKPSKRFYCENFTKEAIDKIVDIVKDLTNEQGYRRSIHFLPEEVPGAIPPRLREYAYNQFKANNIDVFGYQPKAPEVTFMQEVKHNLNRINKEVKVSLIKALPENVVAVKVPEEVAESTEKNKNEAVKDGEKPSVHFKIQFEDELAVYLTAKDCEKGLKACTHLCFEKTNQPQNEAHLSCLMDVIQALAIKNVAFSNEKGCALPDELKSKAKQHLDWLCVKHNIESSVAVEAPSVSTPPESSASSETVAQRVCNRRRAR